MLVYIPKDKTNRFRYGNQLKFFRSQGEMCVVKAMWEYMQSTNQRPPTAPIFEYLSRGNRHLQLARRHVSGWVKEMAALDGKPEGDFDTHSFRAGGACALWAAGYDATTIQTIGRWRSDCWRIYILQDDKKIRRIQEDMFHTKDAYLLYADVYRRLSL
jgi:hypothetical protein